MRAVFNSLLLNAQTLMTPCLYSKILHNCFFAILDILELLKH